MIDKKQILATVKDVPSLPSVVVKLRSFLNDPDVKFDELARVIEFDPGLTANILQLANSAYFGWSSTIRSVKDAVTRLGTNRVFQMVLCMSVAPLVRKPVRGYHHDKEGLWEHSTATAICAEKLTEILGLRDMEEAFTAGLLHDIGKVVLGTFVEIDDEPIREIVTLDNLSFDEAEMMVLGVDHAEVAGILLEKWSLPPDVVSAARWHHQPSRCEAGHQVLTDVVHMADSICLSVGWGGGSDGLNYRLDVGARERLGLQPHHAEEAMIAVMQGVEDLRDLFQGGKKKEPSPA